MLSKKWIRSHGWITLGALFASLITTTNHAHSQMVFNKTWDAAALNSDPTISFPSPRNRNLNGATLEFGAGNANLEKLFDISLVPANTFSTASPVIITATLTLTRLTSDFDPFWGVTDGGGKYVAFNVNDNNNGETYAWILHDMDHNHVGENYTDGKQILVSPGYPAESGQLTAQSVFTLNASATNVFGSFMGKTGNVDMMALNSAAPLSFALWGDHSGELYGVNSVSIRVEGALPSNVPEPGMVGLLVGGLVSGMANVVRWNRLRQRGAKSL